MHLQLILMTVAAPAPLPAAPSPWTTYIGCGPNEAARYKSAALYFLMLLVPAATLPALQHR